ncbi:family 16 glycoside hydrolase [Larkinella soli]|uniref:family 16 glycoside hydrolase n=1 Tax=Larkinella soli TaxID=1770527 RepID=UPI0013E302C9|nr:family 16 glycoside hydrolase [Larkinella soli]
MNLSELADKQAFQVQNRSLSPIREGGKEAVRFDEKPGDGVAWIEKETFGEGVIEVDIRGKDMLQKSFVGIAFHGTDDRTFDAVYFRPFNFRASDPVRRVHAVQYMSLPDFDWQRLRKERTDQFEKAVEPAPDPNGWFHARIVVEGKQVSVFVDGSAAPSLVVTKLNDRRTGRIGLWVGNESGGDFANLKITSAR